MKNFIRTFLIFISIIAQLQFAIAQTASILPQAETQFLDNNGRPVTSGTVDFYIPGSTTRKTTWQDTDRTIANTNPVVLNGSGRAIVYGYGGYRQVLKDRNGNLIWDRVTNSYSIPNGQVTTGDGNSVGTILQWSSLTAPNQYVFAYGQEISRVSFSAFLTAITLTQTVNCTSASNVLSGVSDTSQVPVGASIEVSCISGTATVSSKTSNSYTVSANAIATTSVSATVFPYGNGNGSTTFNVPDLRGRVLAGRDNMGGIAASRLTATYFANASAIGATGGSQSHTLITGELPTVNLNSLLHDPGHNHSVFATDVGVTGGPSPLHILQSISGTNDQVSGITTTGITFDNFGSNTPHSIVQPTITVNYIIKVTPDLTGLAAAGVLTLGTMAGDILCDSTFLCANQNIGLSIISNDRMLANVSGSNAQAAPTTLTQWLDGSCGNVQGSVIYRSASAWSCLSPSTAGFALTTQGIGLNPQWSATVVSDTTSTKIPVQLATPVNVTLSGEQTIDSVLTNNSRVLVARQTNSIQNGIYITSAGAWARTSDFTLVNQALNGTLIYVTNGQRYANSTFELSGTNPITPGVSSINFIQQQPRVVSPLSYGAKGDGVTDDTAALQAASTDAFFQGVCLDLGNSFYKITSTLNWYTSATQSICVKGAHTGIQPGGVQNGAQILWYGATNGVAIQVQKTSFFNLSNFSIFNKVAQGTTVGILFTSAVPAGSDSGATVITGLLSDGFYTGVQLGQVAGGNSTDTYDFQNLVVSNNHFGVLTQGDNTLNLNFYQFGAVTNGYGFYLQNGGSDRIYGGSATGNTISDFYMGSSSTFSVYGWRTESANRLLQTGQTSAATPVVLSGVTANASTNVDGILIEGLGGSFMVGIYDSVILGKIKPNTGSTAVSSLALVNTAIFDTVPFDPSVADQLRYSFSGSFLTTVNGIFVSRIPNASGIVITNTRHDTFTTENCLIANQNPCTAAGGTSAPFFTSTVATGTAPFTVSSTTVVPNLNAALLNGTTFAAPGPIGSGTPSTGAFSSSTATSYTASANFIAPVGAVGTPGFTFLGDLTTGFYPIAASRIGIGLGGTNVWDISTNGSVLHGPNAASVSSPAFGIVDATATHQLSIFSDSASLSGTIQEWQPGVGYNDTLFLQPNGGVVDMGGGAAKVTQGGGLQVGSPTGADKGAGTANFAGAIYANGTIGATCTIVGATAHLTVVKGIVTLCN